MNEILSSLPSPSVQRFPFYKESCCGKRACNWYRGCSYHLPSLAIAFYFILLCCIILTNKYLYNVAVKFVLDSCSARVEIKSARRLINDSDRFNGIGTLSSVLITRTYGPYVRVMRTELEN
jgi:hypothetical protein